MAIPVARSDVRVLTSYFGNFARIMISGQKRHPPEKSILRWIFFCLADDGEFPGRSGGGPLFWIVLRGFARFEPGAKTGVAGLASDWNLQNQGIKKITWFWGGTIYAIRFAPGAPGLIGSGKQHLNAPAEERVEPRRKREGGRLNTFLSQRGGRRGHGNSNN